MQPGGNTTGWLTSTSLSVDTSQADTRTAPVSKVHIGRESRYEDDSLS